MNILTRYWKRILARLTKSAEPAARQAPAPEELERELSVISSENQSLAAQVQRVRTDLERTRDEENRKLADLEQVRGHLEIARDEDRRKLAELEASNSQFQAAREADNRRLLELENRLAGIEAERNQARERVQALETSLAEATTHLEQTGRQIRELQVSSVEQARQFQASIADANERLVTADSQVKVLGSRLDNEHRHVVKTFEELQGRLRKQDVRLNWTFTAAGFAVLLGTVAGAVLIWDVQKNATMLASMSQDIKDLMNTVNGQLGMRQSPSQPARQAMQPARPAVPVAKVPSRPVKGAAAGAQPSPSSASATVNKPVPNPYFLSSAMDGGRLTNREGVKHAMRKDANTFFAKNAEVAGMITLDSGVQYRVVKPGSGALPTMSDKVVVSYVGTKLDGTVIDETYSSGTPATFSMKEILPGWREVLLKMEEGAEFELYMPPNLASRGGVRNRGVTGFEPSIYLIELVQVVKNATTGSPAPAN